MKTFSEFEPEHAYGTLDRQSNLFYVVSQDKIYVYTSDLNFLYQTPDFRAAGKTLAVSFYPTIQITKDHLICGYGSKYSKSFLVKYTYGTLAKQLPLARGFTIVASNANKGLAVTYHESKGIFHIYNSELELIKEITAQKKLGLFKISPNGKLLAFSSNSSNKLTVLDIDSLQLKDFKVHPFGKNYPFAPKDIFRHVNNFWFTDDSEKILLTGDKYLLHLIDLETQSGKLLNGHDLILDMFYNGIEDVQFDPQNKLILTAASDYQIIIWDDNGKLMGRLVGHTGTVSSFECSHNFHTLVSSSVDGTVRFWNRKTS